MRSTGFNFSAIYQTCAAVCLQEKGKAFSRQRDGVRCKSTLHLKHDFNKNLLFEGLQLRKVLYSFIFQACHLSWTELFEKLYIAAPSWKEGHIGQFCFQASGNPLFCLNTSQQCSPAFECGKSASAPINSHLPGPSPGHGVKSPVVLSGPPPLAWSQPAEGRGPHTLLAALTPRSSLE